MKNAPFFAILIVGCTTWAAAQTPGEAVYRARCAGCHDLTSQRIPPRAALQKMPAARILRVLDFGVMMSIAYPLRRDEREAVAKYLGTDAGDAVPSPSAFCSDRRVRLGDARTPQWNGWSPGLSNTRFQSSAAAGLTPAQVRGLEFKWAFAFDGDVSAFNQPTVVGTHAFVGSASGLVYALDTATGCIHWTFQANGPVRSSLLAVRRNGTDALVFSDLVGWTYALDAADGKMIWKARPEEHEGARLTGAAVEHEGVVYIPVASWEESRALGPEYECCTFRGSLVALSVSDGRQVWKAYTIDGPATPMGKTAKGTKIYGPSGAGIWAAPTIDAKRGVVYVATGDNYSTPPTKTSDALMAINLKTGRIAWTRQITQGDAYNSACGNNSGNCPSENGPDYDFGSSAMLVSAGGRDLLVAGQKSGVVTAVDPARNGAIVWQVRVGKGGVNGGVQWGMASDGERIFAAVSDVGRTANTSSDPASLARFILSPTEGGGLTALAIADGKTIWNVQRRHAAIRRRAAAPRSLRR